MSLADIGEHLCLRIPAPFSFLLQALSLRRAFVGNGIITSNLLGFLVLLCIGMTILQLLCTWKAKCAKVIRFSNSPPVLEKTDVKSCDEAFLTQAYREDLIIWRACGCRLQGRNMFSCSRRLSSMVLAYRSVLWPPSPCCPHVLVGDMWAGTSVELTRLLLACEQSGNRNIWFV